MEVKVEKEEVFLASDIVKEEFTIQEVHPAETKVKEAENEPTPGSSQEKQNSNEKKFQCPDCPRTFTALGFLNRHRKLVQDRKRAEETKELTFQCPKCPKAFWAKNHLAKHIKVHSYPDSITCETCKKTFKHRSRLMEHMKIHSEPRYACKECGKKYKVMESVRMHTMKVHLGLSDYDISGEMYNCDLCDGKFPSKKKLYDHQIVHTNERKFKCHLCPVSVKTKSTLNYHLRFVHTEERAFKCDTCGDTFKCKMSLRNHLVKHEKDNQVACKVCGKQVRRDLLRPHMKVHNNKMLECAFCGNKYKWKISIRYHIMKVHLKISEFDITGKKFTCDHCDKEFSIRAQYKKHLSIHNTDMAFKCPLCPNKAFKARDYYTRHKRIFHKEKTAPDVEDSTNEQKNPPKKPRFQYDCKICGKIFHRHRNLKAHLVRHEEQNRRLTEIRKTGKTGKSSVSSTEKKKKKVTTKKKGRSEPEPLAIDPETIKTESIDEEEVATTLEMQNENDYELESWIKVERELIEGEEL